MIKFETFDLLSNPKGFNSTVLNLIKNNISYSLYNYIKDNSKQICEYKLVITLVKRPNNSFPIKQESKSHQYVVCHHNLNDSMMDMTYLKKENLMVRIIVDLYSFILEGKGLKSFISLITDIELTIYYKDKE
jgi:hypothetical protein